MMFAEDYLGLDRDEAEAEWRSGLPLDSSLHYTGTSCLLCSAPATAGDYCDACFNAVAAPDPICAGCGEPLDEADVAAGEGDCLACAAGHAVCLLVI